MLKEGDVVLVKSAIRRRKTYPAHGEQPYRVKQLKCSMVTAERGNHKVTRNINHSSSESTTMSTSMAKTAGTTTLVRILQSRGFNL